MRDLTSIFTIHNTKSVGFTRHKFGAIPFVSNGFYNNGVVGYVTPLAEYTVFKSAAICVSAFCEATVQEPSFLPRGNGGSKVTVLEPQTAMTYDELLFYAAYINRSEQWRFSYYRMVTKDRLERMQLPDHNGSVHPSKTIKELMPKKPIASNPVSQSHFAPVSISTFFDVVKGEGNYLDELPTGKTPLISATNWDNGVLGYVDLPPTFKAPAITVERVGGRAFVQLRDFATVPDDMSVLVPKKKDIPLSLFFLAAATLTSEKWRFSYYRKLSRKRLNRIFMKIPTDSNEDVNYTACDQFLEQCTGWVEISNPKTVTPTKP